MKFSAPLFFLLTVALSFLVGCTTPPSRKLGNPEHANHDVHLQTCTTCRGTGTCTRCRGTGVGDICSSCNGSGIRQSGSTESICSGCNGTGRRACSSCDGTGRCSTCGGTGQVRGE